MNQPSPEFDPLVDRPPARFVVGIDLGTTNSAVCYVDTEEPLVDGRRQVRVFSIPQLVGPGQVEARETLPSFHFQPALGRASGNLRLPWSAGEPDYTVGIFARDEGASTPGRLIASAKSWLCHSGVDRTAALLPWQGAADVERLSPIVASSRFLAHIAAAWNNAFPRHTLADQDLVLTLPASFDEVARELTVQAASLAGLSRVVLIEEPQAAFYAWVYKHADNWHEQVQPGQRILVCDIGGGTTDFTLIRVRAEETTIEPGNAPGGAPAPSGSLRRVQFHRVAVGEHLILGGDNLDLALARHVEERLSREQQVQLTADQWDMLVRSCRRVKETLLSDPAPEQLTVNLPGSGSKLIGGGLRIEVSRDAVRELLGEGFLPRTALDDKPQKRQSGFQEFGLPYAADAAMTRYLASFLTAHRNAGTEPDGLDDATARPDLVLFNGGFFASPVLRQRLLEVLSSWFSSRQQPWSPVVLDHDRLDLAVARGAAYYGMVRRGEGVRIAANLARSYYIRVAADPPVAVCLVPGSATPGQDITLANRTFELTISEPVEFPLLVSSTRLTDSPGDLVPIDLEQMRVLPPIRTVLRTERRNETGSLPVQLHAHLTEIGTIDLSCSEVGKPRSWRLQFDVRSATQTDVAPHESQAEQEGVVDEGTWQRCRELLTRVFGPAADEPADSLMKRLGAIAGADRSSWPTSLLRRMWEVLLELEAGRRQSPTHESRWLNLLGFALRPGYGLAVDDWRVAETWRTLQGKLAHDTPTIRQESLILWRRVAGGLSAGQQRAIAEPLLAAVRGLHRRLTSGKQTAELRQAAESAEVWRLLGSLELLPVPVKVELGGILVDLWSKKKLANVREPMVWTLGRLGQRVPVYGPLNTVVPREKAEQWLGRLRDQPQPAAIDLLAAMQLGRHTGDRHRDLSDTERNETVRWLEQHGAPPRFLQLVQAGGHLEREEERQIFGESLPLGLRLR